MDLDRINRPLLPTDLQVSRLVLLLGEHPWGTWVFPYSSTLGSSLVLRKMGSLETQWDGQPAIVLHRASAYMLAVVSAACTIPSDAEAVEAWNFALRFLCAEPPLELLTFVVGHALLRPMRAHVGVRWVPGPCRCDLAPTRSILAEAMIPELTREQANVVQEAGYDSGHPFVTPPQGPLSSFRIACPGVEKTVTALELLADMPGAAHPDCEQSMLGCLALLARSEEGCMELLRRLAGLPSLIGTSRASDVAHLALRHLYAEESQRPASDPGPFVPLESVNTLRQLLTPKHAPERGQMLARILPVHPTVLEFCRILPPAEPWCRLLETSRRCPLTGEEVRGELIRRVPWLEVLSQIPMDSYVTGSLLTESIANFGGPSEGLVGDVDIFTSNPAELDGLAIAVATAAGAVACRVNGSRWRIDPVVGGAESFTQRADVYVNRMSTVRSYHMPHVRAAFRWRTGEALLHPSALLGLATGIDLDFRASSGTRNSFQILERKWRAGFSVLLNTREYYQFMEYLLVTYPTEETGLLALTFARGPLRLPLPPRGALEQIDRQLDWTAS